MIAGTRLRYILATISALAALGAFTLMGSGKAAAQELPRPPDPVDPASISIVHKGNALLVSWAAPARGSLYNVTYAKPGEDAGWGGWGLRNTSVTIECDIRPEQPKYCVEPTSGYEVGIQATNAGGEGPWVWASVGLPAPAPAPSPTPTLAPAPTATPTPQPTATPAPTPAPTATSTPAPAATPAPTPTPGPTNTPPPRDQSLRGQVAGFEIPPEVALRPIVDEIDSDTDGVIEAWMYNSGLNKVNLIVEISMAVPSGIHISSTDGSFTGGAGRGVAKYMVEPGQGRTIKFHVQADKVGKFTVTSNSKYWPEGREQLWNPISLSHPFTVHQATSRDRTQGGETTPEQTGNGRTAGGGCTIGSIGASGPGGSTAAMGGFDPGMAAIVATLLGIVLIRAAWRRRSRATA